ncbi:MAG: transporter permease [Paenibacillaceae bacterium]|jgi:ABC-2 type transport system permease protein|nr:transporter permease [Paenibacillaceae bacterium]
MRQWLLIYRKEMLEMRRSGKWLWVPIVAILLSVMNPVTSYYMPQILDKAGNLPEGTIIQIPLPSAPEVMMETLSQFGTMGVLILVLASMGIVAGERESGVASIIMVKPVSHLSFITAKWAGILTLAMASFAAGYASAWYYTELLIGHVPVARSLASMGAYSLWLAFVLTVTVMMSTWLRGNGAVAFVSLFATAAIFILTGVFGQYLLWSPARMADHAGAFLLQGGPLTAFPLNVAASLALIAGILAAAVLLFRRQELPE